MVYYQYHTFYELKKKIGMQKHNKQQLVRILLIQAEHFIPTDGQI